MGREKDLTSGALRVNPVSSCPSPDSGSAASPDTGEGFSSISDEASPEQLLLELDSASDSESTSGPESSAEELDSPSPPRRHMEPAF